MNSFRNVIMLPAADGSLYVCPCCYTRTLLTRGGFEICGVCGWEDDGQDDDDADEVRGSPNGRFSLTQGRKAFREQQTKKAEWK